jgi:hypothetical protein
MQSIQRSDKSKVLDSLFIDKKAYIGIERVSNGIQKEDPFVKHATDDVWFIVKGKLVRNNKKCFKGEK